MDAKTPESLLEGKWNHYLANAKLINPANRRKYKIIVVGTGLAGASWAASLAELGFQVEVFTFHEYALHKEHLTFQYATVKERSYK